MRSLLSDRCYRCHGPDGEERKAGLRLDDRNSATRPAESGATAIVPGNAAASELIRRISATNDDERMPPPSSNKSLSPAERELIRQWIDRGAEHHEHWAFSPPRRPGLPTVRNTAWPAGPIDRFVLAKLESLDLTPSPPASRETLIRRVTLDLTGLPSTLADVDAFLNDRDPHAYEHVIDRLLASPHFGERMALDWLDAARFADTNGYHLDNGRDMTAWRAWVINAFNRNLPFDQFTVEQIAGDLLPNATMEQKVASGFNRNHMINFEGGAIPEEYLNAYIVDRVNTTSTVWLGLTMACGQCHDHKFDPFTQRDFYQLYAFFNTVPENGLDGKQGNAAPLLRIPTIEQQQRQRELTMALSDAEKQLQAAENHHRQAQSQWEAKVVGDESVPADVRQHLAIAVDQRTADQQKAIETFYAGLLKNQPQWSDTHQRAEAARKDLHALENSLATVMVMSEMQPIRDTYILVRGQYDRRGEKVTANVPSSLPPLPADAPRNRLGLARWLVDAQNPLTARVIVNRYWQVLFGVGLVKTAEDFGSQGELPSHPELLDWLATEFQHAEQPVDGSPAWNVKALNKAMAMSNTYQQSANIVAERRAHDPENRHLSRGPRFRLSAELIRDQALAVSGLLKHRIGGASVSPYQPEGLWGELSSRGDSKSWTAQFFVQSHGDDLYRRSMYTFWKRTCPPPQMSTFDAPDRETCTVRRARTNTPLQALILMNDPTYVEAARKLAEKLLHEATSDDAQQAELAFRWVTARRPGARELGVLVQLLQSARQRYANDTDAAQHLLNNGESPRDATLNSSELAAWTMVASAILNLDETVTRP